ncbi:MAG: ATP-binding protein [Candidatus Adiutrix sp.]
MTITSGSSSLEMEKLKDLEAKLDIYKSTLTEIYTQYDQKLEELSLVRRMGDALRSTHSLEAQAHSLLETVAHEVVVDRLTLMLTHEKKGPTHLLIRAAYWADREIFSFFEPTRAVPWALSTLDDLVPQEGLTNPLVIMDAAPEYDPLGRPGELNRTLIFLPLMVRRRLLGILVLSRPMARPFSAEDERMLAIMSDQASSSLSNVLLFDDLTRVNQRLVESESRARQVSNYLQRLLETANDAMFTLNNEGIITYANRKAAQWGWPRENMLGREFRSYLMESELGSNWPCGAPPPVDKVFEAILLDAKGELREVILSTSRVDSENQEGAESDPLAPNTVVEVAAFMILVSDMTERRYLERQLIHSEKLASIGVLAAGVAHEVGNPLSAISGYAQILESGVSCEEESREYLAAIINQTGRIQKILKQLLDYSRPSKGALELLNLGETLPQIMSMLSAQRVFSQITINYDLNAPEAPHLVLMDPDHLAQITIIMAMNAAQAMGGQGDFTISLAKKPPKIILNFSDNGPGIAPYAAERIFDPFFTTKNPGEGTGLGLSICQKLVESYNGEISLKSSLGAGATFSITLPAH